MKDPIFLSSPIYPPILPSKLSLSTTRDNHLIPILSLDNFTCKAQLTSLYMHPTDYNFRHYVKNQDFFTHITSKIMCPYQYWLGSEVRIFPLKFNFLRPSIFDLKTDEFDPSFLSLSQKASHHQIYTKFLQHTKPQNYIFVNYKYTSPYKMIELYTIENPRITRYLRNYDPINNSFDCFLTMIHYVHLLYLKNISYTSMIFCCLEHSYPNCETSHSYKTSCFFSTR